MSNEEIFTLQAKKVVSLDLINKIQKIRHLKLADVLAAFRYEIISPKVLHKIVDKDLGYINLMSTIKKVKGSEKSKLTPVYPFKFQDEYGPKFILIDKKCIEFIKKTLKIND